MKIGVLGGTFDPVHHGHLAAAEEVFWALRLDKVLFVPAAVPPHKLGRVITPVEHRVAMLELALQSNAAFTLSRVDVDRPGPAYSVDTIALLQSELGSRVEIFFIVGLDSLNEILNWKQPERLLSMTNLAVVTRAGYTMPDLHDLERVTPGVSARMRIVLMPGLDISSSDLRERTATGRPIKYLVPEAVEAYIYRERLYAS